MSFNDYSKPKDGRQFNVLGVGRISKETQNELSLDDQKAFYKRRLDEIYGPGNYRLTVIATQGSGQILDRDEYLLLCELIEKGDHDLVIAEDLGRIVRRMHAVILCEEAEDTATRVIGIGDGVDTAVDGWETNAVFSAHRHSTFCKDTGRRIRRTQRNRFSNGGIVGCLPYGYHKSHPGCSDDEVSKLAEAEAIYDEWFDRLESGQNYREVSDWLNENNVLTGPYCKSDKWDQRMVARVTFNHILKGERRWNDRVTTRVNKTGRPKTKPAPESEKLSRMVPHMAFIEPERYDRVIRLLKERNAKYKRSESVRNDPRAGIPKRHTRFPGQLCRCGVCGRLFVFGGHGKKDRLMCNGVRDYACWNAMTVSGPDVALAVCNQIREFIKNSEGFEDEAAKEYELQRKSFSSKVSGELKELKSKLTSNKGKLAKQIEAIEMMGVNQAVANRIQELEKEVLSIQDQIHVKEKEVESNPELPSLDEIKAVADQVFSELALDSVELANIMRKAIAEMWILPYRLVDGGHVQPRITFSVSLASLLPEKYPDLPLLRFEGMVDLAKQPVRVKIRKDVVRMVGQGMKQLEIATELGVTKTEVANAMALQRCMIANNVEDPWIPVTSVEEVRDYFKRVRNPRFKFQPLEGFEVTKHPRD